MPPLNPPACPGAGQAAGVAREVPRLLVESLGQELHLRRIGVFLRAEHRSCSFEARRDVGQHGHPGVADPAPLVDRCDRAGTAIGGGAATRGDDDVLGASFNGVGDQQAGAEGVGREGVVVFAWRSEAARGGQLDHRRAVVGERVRRTQRIAPRTDRPERDHLGPQGAPEDCVGALAAVGQRTLHRRDTCRAGARRDVGRHLGGGVGAFEVVGGNQEGRGWR
jgi:hypothetical protein